MYSTFFISIGIAFAVVLFLSLGLHFLGRLFLLSSRRRACSLFSGTPWLPLRYATADWDGQDIEFPTSALLTLRGTFLPHRGIRSQGTILFCHELNGTRLNIEPYTDQLRNEGFDIFAFDFRNHGRSDSTIHAQPTPWITTADMDDVRAALDYLLTRQDVDKDRISVFGLGKGATVALCLAGSDPRIKAVVLDAPIPENRLFDRNCWEVLVKSTRLSRRRFSKFVTLFFRAVAYSISCPIVTLVYAWRRRMLGFWFGCRFINPWPLVKQVRQPMMILHGHSDSMTRADQIQAFCDRMEVRPRLWIVPASCRENVGVVSDDCTRKVARFFTEVS